jgi:Ser/Thr protein kinase RdoA (MazF antagonist)
MSRPDRPFVDRPAGDVAAVTAVAMRAAKELDLGPVRLLRLGMNGVFVAGDAVVRVGRTTAPASAALELSRRLSAAGIAVALPASEIVVVSGELTATVWERLERVDRPIAWDHVGRAVARLHHMSAADLPPEYPLPSPTSFSWWDFDRMLAGVDAGLDDASRRALHDVVARHSWWREQIDHATVVCHGDVHPGNVVMTVDGPVLVDWDLLCLANPAWDHAPMMTLESHWGGTPGEYEAFAGGYGRSMRDEPLARAVAELRLAAATLMRVAAGHDDPAAATEAARRLRYWRGDADWPTWRAQ